MRQAIPEVMGLSWLYTLGLALGATLCASPIALGAASSLVQSPPTGIRAGFELLSSIPLFILAPAFALSFHELGAPPTLALILAVALSGVPLLALQFESILRRAPARLQDAAFALGATRFQAFWLAQFSPTRWALGARALRFALRVSVEVAAIQVVCNLIFPVSPELFPVLLLRGEIEFASAAAYCAAIWGLYVVSEAVFARQESLWRKAA